MPSVYHQAPWIEVEAKHKEEAVTHLRSWWLLENNLLKKAEGKR
jgi:UV DNA damage endonuclease